MGLLNQLEKASLSFERLVIRLERLRAQSQQQLAQGNQEFWNDTSKANLGSQSHWRGEGPFADDELWLKLGRSHMALFDRAAEWAGLRRPLARVVEWGCGGGMNAMAFAPITREYCGVDINPDSLEESKRQLATISFENFVPVLVEAATPEAACEQVPGPCDLFLSTYVFELIPSSEYGLNIMRIAFELLRPGGIALVQIRYNTGRLDERSRLRDYAGNAVHMTTYGLDEFWSECENLGFEPLFVTLLPKQAELGESQYAYFALKK